MKKTLLLILFLLISVGTLASCLDSKISTTGRINTTSKEATKTTEETTTQIVVPTIDTEKVTIPEVPEEKINTLLINCESGTDNCFEFDGTTLTFSNITEDSVYSISGEFDGNIVIDVLEDYKFELEMRGLTIWCSYECPITVLSSDKITITAKKETENFIYDNRKEVTDEDKHSASVFASCDLDIGGKGSLTVVSLNNNGIHTKDDLKVKNLSLSVSCNDNCLKGNDGVTITGGTLTLIAKGGDAIKTSNSDVSSKGNQRGTVEISSSNITIYAACDGIDSSYDCVIKDDTVLNIYTDKYSPYSKEVTATSEDTYYIRFTSKNYQYSVKFYNSDEDYKWVNAVYSTSVNAGRGSYYYYKIDKQEGYEKVQFFIYSSEQELGQEEDYLVKSELLTWNSDYDTFALIQYGSSLSYSWTNYTTSVNIGGGMGGMMDGNKDKGDHSTKGIKASNEIIITSGHITIKSYDDAIHANNDNELENGETPTGNVRIEGGTIEVYSNDDGIHADGTLSIIEGFINVIYSYEGLEGTSVLIDGGDIKVTSKDDGINATNASGVGIKITGGNLYVYAGGDGLDANSRTQYQGIVFEGGEVVVIATSSNNSSIDTEKGYTYSGGKVLAICPAGGMSNESTNCSNFNSVATKTSLQIKTGSTLYVKSNNEIIMSVDVPCSISALVIYLGETGVIVIS